MIVRDLNFQKNIGLSDNITLHSTIRVTKLQNTGKNGHFFGWTTFFHQNVDVTYVVDFNWLPKLNLVLPWLTMTSYLTHLKFRVPFIFAPIIFSQINFRAFQFNNLTASSKKWGKKLRLLEDLPYADLD